MDRDLAIEEGRLGKMPELRHKRGRGRERGFVFHSVATAKNCCGDCKGLCTAVLNVRGKFSAIYFSEKEKSLPFGVEM